MKIFVFWQSLVVGAYRSFFYELAKKPAVSVAVAAPTEFKELGFQLIPCEPFLEKGDSKLSAFTLKTLTLHVQIVLSFGLGRSLRYFFRELRQADGKARLGAKDRRVFFSIAEPYSITALWHYLCLRLSLGGRVLFVCYALQNIKKNLNPVLAAVQKFIFKNSAAIASCGTEQTEVLRTHGYRGIVIDFPLWYDSQRFFPRDPTQVEAFLKKRAPDLLSLSPDALIFGYAGLLAEQKGVKDIFDGLNQCGETLRQTSVLLIAGRGPLESYVQEQCSLLRAKGFKIYFLGPLPSQDMPHFLSCLDMLLIPSRTTSWWKEQFGRIIVEAKACRTLVIGSDSGEIPHVIGRSECLFPEGRFEKMFDIVRHFAEIKAKEPEHWEQILDGTLEENKIYADYFLAERFAKNLSTL